ncbi:MAG: M23 family metallopeptidase [Bacteroidia bacterium]|jgi:murein DD-endopeptidase MepM/ murein hydrolase activator NlpD
MAEKEDQKKRKLIERLRHRYRLVVMNDDTFEEKLSLTLTPLGLAILLGTVTIIMTMLVTSLIAFTPLREYIPGYSDAGVRKNLIKLTFKSDSLEQTLIAQNAFIANIGNVLSGKIKSDSTQNRPDKNKEYNKLSISPSKSEAELRKAIEEQDKYSLTYETEAAKNAITNFSFFTPLKGIVSSSFKASEQHFGLDIVGPENEAIKSTLDGTVILATWSSETGYTITVQHTNNLISVYKHNSVLLKKIGDYVKAGDPIAIIGNSGEQTTGPHLHFELWYNGNPIDPQDYMVF